MKAQIKSVTNRGLYRQDNEDRLLVNVLDEGRALLAIADGMGGHAAGEVAAELAVEVFERYMPAGPDINAQLCDQVEKAHASVMKRASEVPAFKGMGATLTALLIDGGLAFWAHVGDTRIYRLHAGSLTRITEDHTIAGMLLKKGEITREQARLHPYGSVLTRCIGCERHEPDSGVFDLARGDFILLSTDGLHDLMPDEQIGAVLSSRTALPAKLDRMVSACLEAGGRDNITAIIAEIEDL